MSLPEATITETCRCGASTTVTALPPLATRHITTWRDAHSCTPRDPEKDHPRQGAGAATIGFAHDPRQPMGHNNLTIQASDRSKEMTS